MTSVLKNVPVSELEKGFAKVLQEITGYRFVINIKDVNFEAGETVLEIHVLDLGETRLPG